MSEVDLGVYRENLERIHKFVSTVDNNHHADALVSLNWLICKTDAELSATSLDGFYNPEGDGEHPVFSREAWRTAVANDDTISGYWDWVEYQITNSLAGVLDWV